MKKGMRGFATALILGIIMGFFFSSENAFGASDQTIRVGGEAAVSCSYPGGYDYTWYADSPSIVRVNGSGTNCRLTGLKTGTTTVHCQYKFDNTYYDYILKRPVTDVYVEEEKFLVRVTNGEVLEGETGETVVLEKCDAVKDMACGLIPVKRDGLWGFVDKNRKLVIPFQFDDVKHIFNYRTGMACVQYNGKYYGLNRKGEKFGPLISQWYYTPCNELTKLVYSGGAKTVYLRADGTQANVPGNVDEITDISDAALEKDALIPALATNGMYGYLNKNYQWAIQPQFDEVRIFHGDRAAVVRNSRWCFIDRSGRVVSELPEEVSLYSGFLSYRWGSPLTTEHLSSEAFYLSDGLCPATDCKKKAECVYNTSQKECHTFFYINEKGEKAVTEYQWGTAFEDGMAIVVDQNGYEGVINARNEVLIPFEYKYTYNKQETPGGGMKYLGEGVFAFHEGFEEPYILLNSSGGRVTQKTYDEADVFSNGIARVGRDGKYGYIDASGTEIVPVIYESLRFYGDRYALGKTSYGYRIVENPMLPCPHEVTEVRDAVNADCTKDGYTGDTYCAECGTKTASGSPIKAAGHRWGSMKSDEKNHWKECACGATAEKAVHTFKWVTDKRATAEKMGIKHEECSVCGRRRNENTVIGRLGSLSLKNAKIAGISGMNYTGKALEQKNITVRVNGELLMKGTDYKVSYKNNVNIGTATVVITGKGTYKDSVKKTFRITVTKGKTYAAGGMKYKVTNADTGGKGTVTLTGTAKKKTDAKFTDLKVADTVKIGGKSFKITAIGDKAFKGYTKLKKVTAGKNVRTVGKESFSGCTGLTTVKLGAGLTKISDKAFYGCRRLKSLTITSKKLKVVGKQALKNINKNAKIKVPSSVLGSYKKLFKSSTGFSGGTMKISAS